MSVSVFKDELPSGLRIITVEAPLLNQVAAKVFVGVGSNHEPEAQAGISHFLEHLVFEGTSTFRDVAAIHGALLPFAGTVGAHTGHDETVYEARAHVSGLQAMLTVLGEMLTRPRMGSFEGERGVVLEEMLTTEDRRWCFAATKRIRYGDHPLARRIIGFEDSVQKLTRSDLRAWFKRGYVSGNMVLVVAGGVTRDAVLRQAGQAFRHLRRGPRLAPVPAPSPMPGPRYRAADRNGLIGTFYLSFEMPPLPHPDAIALRLFWQVLIGGASARLGRRFVDGLGVFTKTEVFMEHEGGTASLGIWGELPVEKVPEAMTAALRQVTLPVTGAELADARERVARRLVLHRDDPAALCDWYGDRELSQLLSHDEEQQRAGALTCAQLDAAVRAWLTPSHLVAAVDATSHIDAEVWRIVRHADDHLRRDASSA